MKNRKLETVNKPARELVRKLNQTQGRILLALILAGKPIRLKDLASIVGAPTTQTCSGARDLVECGVIDRARGIYQVSPFFQSVCFKSIRRLRYKQKNREHPSDAP